MHHPVDQHVGTKLKELRRQRKLSQADIAKRVGLSFQQVQKYETGANRISASKLFELAQVLEVPVAQFFSELETNLNCAPHDAKTVRATKASSTLERDQIRGRILDFIEDVSEALTAKTA